MRVFISYRSAPPVPSPNIRRLQEAFGIGLCERVVKLCDADIDLPEKGIVFIGGPSGCGKSSILRFLMRNLEGVVDLNATRLPDKPLIDTLDIGFGEALALFGMVGLGEAFVLLRRYGELSDGQRYRARLAAALARQPAVLVADEFCSTLDRLTARVVAFNLRRLVWRRKFLAICAAAQNDFLHDLQPDLTILFERGNWVVRRHDPKPAPVSFAERITVREGTKRDWDYFARWHYRSHSLGIVDRIFVMELEQEPVGIVVYGHPMGACALRNRATGGRYAGRPVSAKRALLDKELRVVQRIVVEPRFRGLGLAARLLRETMPRLGVRFVECITVMGGFSGFLQKAGFVCVGRVSAPRIGRLLLAALRQRGLDERVLTSPSLLERFLEEARGSDRILWGLVERWWRGRRFTKGGGGLTPHRAANALASELLSRPFYFICDLRRKENGASEDKR